MIVIEDKFKVKLHQDTFIALGSFDGLHLGHMALINKVLELSKLHKVSSMVYTFKNHPLSVIKPEIAPKLIMSNETKLELLETAGIDLVNLVDFDAEFMKISPEEFVENIINYYNVKGIVVGFNFRFGYKNQGDVNLLKEMQNKLGYELHVIDSVSRSGEIISSSRIRELITVGNFKEVNNLLYRPYMLEGIVEHGKQIGRTIGFPTANIEYNKSFVLPGIGVYYTIVEYNNTRYKGITSVGYNPTVNDVNTLSIETYILNFSQDIYEENLKVFFMEKIRDEIKFNSLEALSRQLFSDKRFAEARNMVNF